MHVPVALGNNSGECRRRHSWLCPSECIDFSLSLSHSRARGQSRNDMGCTWCLLCFLTAAIRPVLCWNWSSFLQAPGVWSLRMMWQRGCNKNDNCQVTNYRTYHFPYTAWYFPSLTTGTEASCSHPPPKKEATTTTKKPKQKHINS